MPAATDTLNLGDALARLTPQQQQIVHLLAAGESITAAAASAGLHRTTIHHWRRTQPHFALALHDAHTSRAEHWRAATQARADLALRTVDQLLADPHVPASVRLKAALHILTTATSTTEPEPTSPLLSRERQAMQEDHDPAFTMDLTPLLYAELNPTPEAPESNEIHHHSSHSSETPKPFRRPQPKTGRNELCPCHSGRKYKHCCLNANQTPTPAT